MKCDAVKVSKVSKRIEKELSPPELLNLSLSIISSNAVFMEKKEKGSSEKYIDKIVELIRIGVKEIVGKDEG